MKGLWIVSFLLCAASAAPLVALADEQEGAKHVTIKDVAAYLDKLDLKYDMDEQQGIIAFGIAGDHGQYDLAIGADTELDLVFIAVVDYLKVPPAHRNCDKVLRRLMELNWKLNLGKFEWDSSDGEVRFTYVFCTDDGLGFKSFAAALGTLVDTADQLHDELVALVEAE
ncbi:MAG: YbjN domain-containing protein [Armatimonadetes bacterium]|nr:YbjN domain-containing protein [Armatimonadota bacterium]